MFTADLHIHSKYSRATSKDMELNKIAEICEIKGIDVVVTGDFIHPEWLKEIKENLEPLDNGLFKLKNSSSKVQFILGGEISSIYKHNGKVRKIHNMIYMPDIESVEKLSKSLEKIGNIHSDGRPILGMNSKDLLSLCLEINENTIFIPAHIWTPWFSLFGKMSGYDDIEECFEDLTQFIYALETGLSSDPPMNWHLSMLDRFTLVSNSDAHSPLKIGREANIFLCEKDYFSILKGLKNKEKVITVEFFPEEGKYHYDGHRKCNVCLNPEEAIKLNNICPVCKKPLTFGVLHRVLELSDRKSNIPQLQKYYSLIPLEEIISQAVGVNSSSKKVKKIYQNLIKYLGNELAILKDIEILQIKKVAGELIAHGIKKMREGKIEVKPGFDGEYGKIIVINEDDKRFFSVSKGIFVEKISLKEVKRENKKFKVEKKNILKSNRKQDNFNREQIEAIKSKEIKNLIIAGPGTGKTFTLVGRINYLLDNNFDPRSIYAITFTNKACNELKERIKANVNIHTFHSLAKIIIEKKENIKISIIDPEDELKIIKKLIGSNKKNDIEKFYKNLFKYRTGQKPDYFFSEIKEYIKYLKENNFYDFDSLIFKANDILKETNPVNINHLLIDEFQDINQIQFELIENIVNKGASLFAIGDPDQSIYGFRGSSPEYFEKIDNAFKVKLKLNYRSCENIIEFSKKIISTEIQPVRECEGKVKLLKFENEEKEAKFIANEIKKLVGGLDFHTSIFSENYISFKDIAILFRVNAIANKLKKILKENGIPFQEADEVPLNEVEHLDFNVEKVNLLSFHASKGLEFKVVFIIGVEDKILPFSIGNFQSDSEEEKRLLYVAITRAKDILYICSANRRFIYGENISSKVSRFLNKNEFKFLKKKKNRKIKTIFT